MKELFTLLGVLSANLILYSQDVKLEWARKLGSTATDHGYSIAIDGSGSVITTGQFSGTIDFDPGPGTFFLTPVGNRDIFISKLDQSGNFVWAIRIGAGANDEGHSIAVDASGNIYTTGGFNGTVDFDPGLGVNNLTSVDDLDVFILKLSASGNFIWARNMGGGANDVGMSITVDAIGNVYSTGYYEGIADFDPGPGVFNLLPVDDQEIFISKLDAAGNFVWAKNICGGANDIGYSIEVDAAGNVHTTGSFNGLVDFDPGPGTFNLTSVDDLDIFICKLDPSGNLLWAKNIGGHADDNGYSIKVDASGNVYTTGSFNFTADFDPGPGTFNLTSNNVDIFISKLDASGGFVWAKTIGSVGNDRGYSLTLDPSGNVYTTGTLNGTADFNPGAGTFNLSTAGGDDVFISKLNAAGNFAWAKRLGGPGEDAGFSIAVDLSGNVYTTGYFSSKAEPAPGENRLD